MHFIYCSQNKELNKIISEINIENEDLT